MLDLLGVSLNLLQTTSETATSFPQLPLELWEHIIDIVAENGIDETTDAMLKCILTCRAWVSRCQYHLFSEVVLRSRDHVHQVCKVLSTSPVLRQRVKHIWIDAKVNHRGTKNGLDQSWISAAPFQLAPLVSKLRTLKLSNIDFTQLNPTFCQAFTAFAHPIESLYLFYVRWSRYSQVARIAWATRAQNFILRENLDVDVGFQDLGVDLGISGRFLSRARVQSMEMVLRPDQFNFIPFAKLGHLPNCIRNLKITVDFPEVSSHLREPFLQSLGGLSALFERLCSRPSPTMYPVWVVLENGDWFVEMAGTKITSSQSLFCSICFP